MRKVRRTSFKMQVAPKPRKLQRLGQEPKARIKPKRQILLCPGPVNTSPQVRMAMSAGEICHREPEFAHLLQTIRVKLLHALGLDGRYTAVILSGSGTCALEAAVLASLEPGRKLLVLNNGVYGSRIAQLARIHGLGLVEIRSPVTERPDLQRVEAALKREPSIGTVAMVHHETSTGLLNPVETVGALTRRYHRRFLIDAISSLGAEKLELEKNNIGLCVGSSGKCLHGVPGLSFVLIAQEETPRVLKQKARSLYLDLAVHLKAQESGDPPFTPAIPLFLAFHAALDGLIREGLKGRIAHYRQRAQLLRLGFKRIGLGFILDEKLLSNTLTALWLPKGVSYVKLHDALKKFGFVIYAGQGELKGKIFRVAHMGEILLGDLKEFLRVLKGVVAAASS